MNEKDNQIRKPYCKPRVEQVRLIPEQAVLAGCSVSGASSQIGGDCQSPGNCPFS